MQIAGIGAGPANLSLASLLYPTKTSNIFFDKKPTFSWHEGMQIPNAGLQVSFIKDLVTLADPTNPFSFLAFLHEGGRMYHFLNARFDAVTRREFSLYYEWAARKNGNIMFGEEVLDIEFDDEFVVRTTERIVRSNNIAVGVGKAPNVPDFAIGKLGPTQFHSADFLRYAQGLAGKRVAVVGSGQSGAEIFQDLVSREGKSAPRHTSWISNQTCFWPIDDSPFTNDLFMPCHAKYFASLDEVRRHQFLKDNVLASDGVSARTLQSIYQSLYLRRFIDGNGEAAMLMPNRRVTQVMGDSSNWLLLLRHHDCDVIETLKTDVVIWATGYRNTPMPFLNRLIGRIDKVGEELRVDDSFAVAWDGPANRSIFIQNASRSQKGLADPNLSLLAWRSERIIERLTGARSRVEAAPSAIAWSADISMTQRKTA